MQLSSSRVAIASSVAALAFVLGPAIASASLAPAPSPCATAGTPFVTLTQKISNDPDSGLYGNWATDGFTENISVWVGTDGVSYCANANTTDGTFITTGPKSPQTGASLPVGIPGTLTGGINYLFASSSSSMTLVAGISTTTSTHIDLADNTCSGGSCSSGAFSQWESSVFSNSGSPAETFAFNYTAGNGSTWQNADPSSGGNTGDITNAPLSTVYVNASTGRDSNAGSSAYPFKTIQAAINGVATGGTVNVSAGTYTENLTLNNPVSILGPNASINPITGTRGAEAVLTGTVTDKASNTTIKGFTITDPSWSGATIKGVWIYSNGPVIGNIDIENNIFSNITNGAAHGAYGVMVQGEEDGVVVSHNEFVGITAPAPGGWAHAIEITPTGSNPIVPQHVTVNGNGFSMITNASGIDQFAFSVDSSSGIFADASQVTFHDNNLTGVNVRNLDTAHTLDAGSNYWGADAAPVSQTDSRTNFFPWCTDAICATTVNGSTGTVVVDSDWSGANKYDKETVGGTDYYYGVNAFSKIQDAVNAASSGGTVNVAPGIYTEQVTINKSLSLVGAGRDSTTIKAPTTGRMTISQVDPSAGTTPYTWDYVISAYAPSGTTIDARIDGITIDANGQNRTVTTGYDEFVGVFFRDVTDTSGTHAGLFNSRINDFGTRDKWSDGVTIFGNSHLTISGDDISQYAFTGILVYGDGGSAADPNIAISNNDITGFGTAAPSGLSVYAQNGVLIGYGATGTVNGNRVKNHGIASSLGSSVGIYVSKSDALTISNNTVTASVNGIDLERSANNTVSGNTISGATGNGMYLGSSSGNAISSNIISGVHSPSFGSTIGEVNSGSAGWAIGLDGAYNRSGLIAGTNSSNNHITANNISSSDVAIDNWIGSGNVVNGNTLNGNFVAVHNNTINTVDATQNYWGASTGPAAGAITGTGVSYRPWCRDSNCSGSGLDTTPVSVSSGSTDHPRAKGTMVVTVTITFNKSTMNTAISPIVVAGFPSPVGSTTVQQTQYTGTSWQGTVTVPQTLLTAGQTVPIEVSGAEDVYGNQLQGTSTPTSFVVDTVSPAINSIATQQISAGTSGWLKVGDRITFTVTPFPVEPDAKIVPLFYNGKPIVWSSSDSGATYVATYTVAAGDTGQASPLQLTGISMTDAAGNVSGTYDSTYNGATGVTKGIDTDYPVVTVPSDVYASSTAQVSAVAADAGSGVGNYQWSGSGVTFGNATAADTTVTAATDNTYPLQLAVTDAAGNQTVKRVNLHWDTTPPSIGTNSDISGVEANGPSGRAVTFADPSASDSGSGLDSVSCAPASGSTFALGTTTVTCTAADKAGNSATSHFDIGVVDTAAPMIALNGDSSMNVAINNAFADPGVTVVDIVDGTSDVATTTGAVDTSIAGTYTLTYGARDAHGNYAAEKARTVVVEGTAFTLATSTSGTSVTTGTLATGFTASTTGSGITATFSVPGGLHVTGTSTWNGVLSLPAISTGYTGPTAPSGFTDTVTSAVEIGASGQSLTFDKGVRILFSGQAGNHVGWSLNGTFTEITTACSADSQAAGDALAAGGDCKIAVGSDLVVWTKHFTTFVAYAQTANPAPVSSGGGGGGGPMILGSVNGGQVLGASTGPTGQVLGVEAYNFAADLTIGSSGTDVAELQKVLIAEGDLALVSPTGYFGALTKAAVIKYQKAHGISPASGYVGALTRAELNKGGTPGAVLGASTGPTKLTASQVQSLVTLLQAFGVEEATIAKVKAALGW